ncbi:uncharacterized protein LOC128202962 [Mya arenaria]|uniref:uncharacterized protein LOC128202962 n=1 Tax=Mya arenaria TaxID=6604 RepID=UPI0022E7CDCC|nr:uncharacterized protein LOC128202962 [Mya arenaria]
MASVTFGCLCVVLAYVISCAEGYGFCKDLYTDAQQDWRGYLRIDCEVGVLLIGILGVAVSALLLCHFGMWFNQRMQNSGNYVRFHDGVVDQRNTERFTAVSVRAY